MNQAPNRTPQASAWADSASVRNSAGPSAYERGTGHAPLTEEAGFYGSGVPGDPHGPLPTAQSGWSPDDVRAATLLSEESDIVLDLRVRSKRSALARMAAALGKKAGLRQDMVLAAMLRRERFGSTVIGHGVAIPHGRVDGLAMPAAVLARLQHPIEFGAPDGDPVDLLLAVLWPRSDNAGFLPALARLSRMLRHSELLDGIRTAETPAQVLDWWDLFQMDRRRK